MGNQTKQMKDMNLRHWPKAQINIEKACTDLFLQFGQFDLRRGPQTAKAKKVVKAVQTTAIKYGLTYDHLYRVYFGKE